MWTACGRRAICLHQPYRAALFRCAWFWEAEMAFREDFVWGAASSAYQTEGCPTADGGGRERLGRVLPQTRRRSQTARTARSPATAITVSKRTSGFWHRSAYRAYRFSTSWARIDPNGDGRWNEAGLQYYDRVVDCCLENGVTPWMTLYHWELPQALEEKGGWLKRETAERFSRFAGMMAAHFKGRVRHFITLNEPQIVLKLGYADGVHAPGNRYPLPQLVQCWKNLMLAHGLSFRAIRQAAPDAKVGIASTGKLCYPHSPADETAARLETFRLSDSRLDVHAPDRVGCSMLRARCAGRRVRCRELLQNCNAGRMGHDARRTGFHRCELLQRK